MPETLRNETSDEGEQATSDEGGNRATPQVSAASNLNPDDYLTITQCVDLVTAAADILAARSGIDALGWEEAIRLLDRLRSATETIKTMDSLITRHVYLTGEHGDHIIEGLGKVKVSRSRDRRAWDERGVAQAVLDAHMEERSGEMPTDLWDVAEWLLEVYGVSYCRVTPLRAMGLDPAAFCEDTPGKPTVTIHS